MPKDKRQSSTGNGSMPIALAGQNAIKSYRTFP